MDREVYFQNQGAINMNEDLVCENFNLFVRCHLLCVDVFMKMCDGCLGSGCFGNMMILFA